MSTEQRQVCLSLFWHLGEFQLCCNLILKQSRKRALWTKRDKVEVARQVKNYFGFIEKCFSTAGMPPVNRT